MSLNPSVFSNVADNVGKSSARQDGVEREDSRKSRGEEAENYNGLTHRAKKLLLRAATKFMPA